jgi:hypothetical protein
VIFLLIVGNQDKNRGSSEAMRVLFVSANRVEINMPTYPLGLACVAEATRRAGHHVELVDLMGVTVPCSVLGEAIHGLHPEVVGISVRNIDDQNEQNPRFYLVRGLEEWLRETIDAWVAERPDWRA